LSLMADMTDQRVDSRGRSDRFFASSEGLLPTCFDSNAPSLFFFGSEGPNQIESLLPMLMRDTLRRRVGLRGESGRVRPRARESKKSRSVHFRNSDSAADVIISQIFYVN
jgi:hypothetical protein